MCESVYASMCTHFLTHIEQKQFVNFFTSLSLCASQEDSHMTVRLSVVAVTLSLFVVGVSGAVSSSVVSSAATRSESEVV